MTSNTAHCENKSNAWIFIGVLLIGLSLAAGPLFAAQCPDGPEGIAAYWSLEEGIVSGAFSPYEDQAVGSQALSGQCEGGLVGCPVREENGVFGAAQDFDGGNDGIFVAANPVFDWAAGESFTVEAWVKRSPNGVAVEEVIAARRDADSSMQWRLSIENLGTGVHARVSLTDTGGNTDLNLNGTKEIANNIWHHLAFVYDAGDDTIAILVDGQVDASSAGFSFNGGFTSASAKLTIGYVDDSGDPKRFDGVLDEVALYDEALADRDLAGHYYLARNYCEVYDEEIKVMPLGDSITMDSTTLEYNGYRKPLWDDLFTDLVWADFSGRRFSGTLKDGSTVEGPGVDYATGELISPIPEYPDDLNLGFDIDHEGHPGITAREMAGIDTTPNTTTFMDKIFASTPDPDVVLLHIGSNVPGNDVIGPTITAEDIRDGAKRILDRVWGANAKATIIVAKIILPRESSDWRRDILNNYNGLLEDEVATRIDNGEKLILADMTSSGANLLSPGDYADPLHPDASGYAKMAGEWLTHLDTFMPRFETPTFVTTSLPAATRGVAYSTTVTTSGRPAPDFVLTSGPTGMVIDQDGQLTWTPPGDAPAQVSVRITAVLPGGNPDWSSSARNASRTFTLAINNRPSAQPETYGPVASLIDFSVAADQGLLINDSDPDSGDSLTAVLVDGPSNGTVILAEDGSFTYRHTGGSTSDSFTYAASDGKEQSEPAVVTFEIQPALSTQEETPITISLSDFVATPAGTTAVSVDSGAYYTVNSTTVTPAKDFDDVLTVGVRFLANGSEVGRFDLGINVVGINDAPVIVGQNTISITVDTVVEITPVDLVIDDPDNQIDDFLLSLSPGDNYTVSGNMVTPAAGFSGTFTVRVVVSDGNLESAPFDLTVTVGSGDVDDGGGGGGCFIDSALHGGGFNPGLPGQVVLAFLIGLVWAKGAGLRLALY